MKLGILATKTGYFIFEMPDIGIELTYDYIKSNMMGWLFHSSNVYEYLSLLPIEKCLVLCDGSSKYGELMECSLEDIKNLSLSVSKKRVLK